MEVKIGKHLVELKKPTSFATRTECRMAIGQSPLLGLCAALNACWGGKPLRTKWKRGHALDVGADTLDELVDLGVEEAAIYEAAQHALSLIVDVPREDEVATLEGFTDPQTEPSTP